MFDYNKLRGRIVEKYGSISGLCNALKITNVTASRKLNGLTGFSQEDIEKWSKALDIDPDDYAAFYFTHKV